MEQQDTKLEAFQVIGIKTRTTNADEMRGAGKISELWNTFHSKQMFIKIPGKLDKNILAVYFDYESDVNGAYSLLVGVKVDPGTLPPEARNPRLP